MQEQNTSSDAQRSSSLSGVRARLIQCLNHKIRQGIRYDTAAFMEIILGIKPTPYFTYWMKEFDDGQRANSYGDRRHYRRFETSYAKSHLARQHASDVCSCAVSKRFEALLLLGSTGHHFRKD